MYFGVRQGSGLYLTLALIRMPVFVNKCMGSSSKTLYSAGPKKGRRKKSYFFVCNESNLNLSLFMDILVRPFFSIEIESETSGPMILTLTPYGTPVTLKMSDLARLYILTSLVSVELKVRE